jgi:leucyl-tRNA synthetase
MGPFDQAIPWGEDNIIGVRRFLEKVWRIQSKVASHSTKISPDKKLENLLHKTIKKVGEDIESMSFNTAISSMMILINEFDKQNEISKDNLERFLKILSPFAPHIAEEIWSILGHKTLISSEPWPKYDKNKIAEEKINIVVQVNGRMRSKFETEIGTSENEAKNKALLLPEVQKWLGQSDIKKVIFVPNKIINFVI